MRNRARQWIGWVGALCLAGGSMPAWSADVPPVEKPAAEKPAGEKPAGEKPAGEQPEKPAGEKPVAPMKSKAIPDAIAALTKEFKAYLKDPANAHSRAKSDYFKENPAPEVTPEMVLKALEAPAGGGGATEAYVKWQLLSAVPAKFPDELATRAIAAYRRAPMPHAHPGMNKRELKKKISGMKKEDIGAAQKMYDAVLEEAKDANFPLLAYRDDLYSRLPGTYEALSAGLEDVGERASSGLAAQPMYDNVAGSIRSWSLTKAKSGQIRAIISTLSQLQGLVSHEDNKPFHKIGEDKGVVNWKTGGTIDPKKIEEMIKFLNDAASSSLGGGLKFKEKAK